jgi:hypothetical protein
MTLDAATVTAIIDAADALEPTLAELVKMIVSGIEGNPPTLADVQAACASAGQGLLNASVAADLEHDAARAEAEAALGKP